MRKCERCGSLVNLHVIELWNKRTPQTNSFTEGLVLMQHFFHRRYRCSDHMKGIIIGATYNNYIIRHIHEYTPEIRRMDMIGICNPSKPYEFN